MSPQRIQRKRERGWRMPEGAIYVGRPSHWGNPWPVGYAGDIQPWLALSLGCKGDEAGRRKSAVLAFRAWLTGSRLPIPTEDGPGTGEGGDLEYSDGTVRHVSDIVVGVGVLMLGRAPIAVPTPPDLAPLRGHDLACWCPEECGVEVALYGVEYGDRYEPCRKPRGHVGSHDPSVEPWCHADVLLELANADLNGDAGA